MLADGFAAGDGIGPKIGLSFVHRGAFGRTLETRDRRGERVHAFVIGDRTVFRQIVQQIAVAVDRRVYDDLLRTDRSIDRFRDRQRTGVVVTKRDAHWVV